VVDFVLQHGQIGGVLFHVGDVVGHFMSGGSQVTTSDTEIVDRASVHGIAGLLRHSKWM